MSVVVLLFMNTRESNKFLRNIIVYSLCASHWVVVREHLSSCSGRFAAIRKYQDFYRVSARPARPNACTCHVELL